MIDIKWDKRYLLGNETIDLQHHVFIDLLRSSSIAVDSHLNLEHTKRALEEFVLYAKFHFFSEETLMIKSNYPNYELHRKVHVQLIDTLGKKIGEYLANKETGDALVEFIFEWFVVHTLHTDKEFTDYLNSHHA